MTSSKSIGCWPSEATLTMREGAAAFSNGSSRWASRKPEIVHGEAQLVTVATLLPMRPVVLRADAGIADEDVQALVITDHRRRELARPCHRRQIGLIEGRRSVAG